MARRYVWELPWAAFERDLAHGVDFSVAAYKQRSLATRLMDSTMRLCSPLL